MSFKLRQAVFRRMFRRLLPIACLQACLMAPPAIAADQLFFHFGPAEFSIETEELRTFGQSGEAPPLLRNVLVELEPAQVERLQQLFSTRIEIKDISTLSRFLYTAQGEMLLRELGQILQSESGLSGFYGLRAALVQAAEADDLTIPTVLERFPSARIRINQSRLFELADAWERFNQQNKAAIAQASPQAIPSMDEFDWQEQRKIRNRGAFQILRAAELTTPEGDRADLYVPQLRIGAASTRPAPVIVISHGLGGDRRSFTYLVNHYVSHGFGVVVPEHPLVKSDSLSFQSAWGEAETAFSVDPLLKDDWAKEFVPEDFARRPQGVSRLLDELERRVQTDPQLQNRLDPKTVGVVGQSFGGYGALALGGAVLNLDHLQQHCPADVTRLNPSLALQCQALGLPGPQSRFADARVKAVAALNPVGSAIFGPAGMGAIEVPVLILSGSQDRVTPALAEQIEPFGWLRVRDRYLMMMEGGTHFSLIEGADEMVDEVTDRISDDLATKELASAQSFLLGKSPMEGRQELKASSLAFFQAHLADRAEYRRFLVPTTR